MLPTVWPGDTLVVDHVVPDQVRIGDVVVVSREGKLCAHRVTGVVGNPEAPRWITQGDALPVPDRPVAKNELMGRVAYLIRAGRLVPVPAELSGVDNVIAKLVRRSGSVARALVYLNRKRQTSKKSVLPCQS
ncbi:MAG: S24/S26 family peptidase [Candidatus Sulfotelmatobacter sp.]